jgi:hypothetical protein
MIEERVGPIIERGDVLFNNLRNIQRRRLIRNATSSAGNQEIFEINDYEDLLNYERHLNEDHNGYNEGDIKEIRQAKFGELSVQDRRNVADDAVCSICCDNYSHSDQVKVLDCTHIYHVKCIGEWLKRNKNCPL